MSFPSGSQQYTNNEADFNDAIKNFIQGADKLAPIIKRHQQEAEELARRFNKENTEEINNTVRDYIKDEFNLTDEQIRNMEATSGYAQKLTEEQQRELQEKVNEVQRENQLEMQNEIAKMQSRQKEEMDNEIEKISNNEQEQQQEQQQAQEPSIFDTAGQYLGIAIVIGLAILAVAMIYKYVTKDKNTARHKDASNSVQSYNAELDQPAFSMDSIQPDNSINNSPQGVGRFG